MFCPRSTTVSPAGVRSTFTGFSSWMRRTGGACGAMSAVAARSKVRTPRHARSS
jgi:hypothetical protein